VDLTSRILAFEKTDASILGCGSSAVVYKGILDDKPVAIKARKAFRRAALAAVHLKSCCRLQAFKLEGLSQAARSKVRPSGIQITARSVREWHMQVYEDMKSELAIMTKPRDPNVLVVYGVYVIRPAFRRGQGGASFERCCIFPGRRRRRSCCSSPICGSARHATSSTIGSAESRSRDLCRCTTSALHLSSASAALGCCA
jgi:hypothetical protein